ncbi:phosphotransferase [Cellulomonas sp. KRMCY2]|uniref:phosphotransferase n=1 Tax=Cellulomonas sp. KRMCY2 TaxID=1304865 RepID=UPI00045E7422|nr:phosphotransferase [Cellulomonas sp. KRMCY2]
MPRSPLALAALATVAVTGLDAYDVRRPTHSGVGVDTAIVVDAAGGRWVVQAPQDATAGAALEAEVALLAALAVHVDAGRLPFDVPRAAGFAHLPEGGRAVVHRQLPGHPLQLELLGPGPGLAAAVGRAIAALHELPHATIEDAGLPVYEAEAYRRRRLSEVDEAARTGHVPATLLRRWEHALEDVALWRFQPTVVHGDLSTDHVLCSRTAPTGILGWSEAKVADPADDLAWLLVAAPHEAVDPILEAYNLRRTELTDRHLADRALLAGELALARWLLHGVRADDAAIIDDATAMLVELDGHTAPPAPAPVAARRTTGRWGSVLGRDDDVREDGVDHVGDDDEVSDDEVSNDAAPDDAAPDDAAPDDVAPADVAPDDAVPDDEMPDDAAPADAIRDDVVPDDGLDDGTSGEPHDDHRPDDDSRPDDDRPAQVR